MPTPTTNSASTESNSNQHIQWLDFLKGVAIFLVVLGHTVPFDTFLYTGIYAFHMPLFFMLAGYTAALSHQRSSSCLTFLKKRSISVWVPLTVWAFFACYFCSTPAQYAACPSWGDRLHEYLTGNSNWFLAALFCLQVLFTLFALLTNRFRSFISKAFIAGCLFVGIFILHKLFGRTSEDAPYWTMLWLTNAYVFFIPFFAGVFLQQFQRLERLLTETPLMHALFGLIALLLIMYADNNWGKALIGTAICLFLIGSAKKVQLTGRLAEQILFLGKNTLVIFLVHVYFFPRIPADWTAWLMQNKVVLIAACTLISIASCYISILLGNLLQKNRYLAFFLFGKTR